jgi:D-glycero-D-manno-heptose 1,7-bisphosphate phosphatase
VQSGPHPAVFLDRDGTLIEEVGYLDRVERLELFPWTIEALRLMRRAGFKLVVITNQAGVARGYFDEALVQSVHRYLGDRFAAAGAAVDAFYYCPHHPEATVPAYRANCACRKPNPGLVEQAVREHAIDLEQSFVVGDRWLDVRTAQNAGARGILVRTGYGAHESRHPEPGVSAAVVVDHVFQAASWIVRHGKGAA